MSKPAIAPVWVQLAQAARDLQGGDPAAFDRFAETVRVMASPYSNLRWPAEAELSEGFNTFAEALSLILRLRELAAKRSAVDMVYSELGGGEVEERDHEIGIVASVFMKLEELAEDESLWTGLEAMGLSMGEGLDNGDGTGKLDTIESIAVKLDAAAYTKQKEAALLLALRQLRARDPDAARQVEADISAHAARLRTEAPGP